MVGASGSLGLAGAAVSALQAGCDLLCLGTENSDDQLADIERAVGSAVADGTLTANRIQEATSRVRRLATDLEAAREAAGQPPDSVPGWSKGEAELVRTFDIQPWAADWRAKASGGYTVVRLETNPNIAVGATPWGPFAALRAELVEGLSAHSAFAAQHVWSLPSNRHCRLFNPRSQWSSLAAISTNIVLPERLSTACVRRMSMCWWSTWVGHQTTAATPTWLRSARRL
jgi:hypothetical protein